MYWNIFNQKILPQILGIETYIMINVTNLESNGKITKINLVDKQGNLVYTLDAREYLGGLYTAGPLILNDAKQLLYVQVLKTYFQTSKKSEIIKNLNYFPRSLELMALAMHFNAIRALQSRRKRVVHWRCVIMNAKTRLTTATR